MKELRLLRDEASMTMRFMKSISQSDDVFSEFEKVIDDAFTSKNLRGMKMLVADVRDWARSMSQDDQRKLQDLILSKLNIADYDLNSRGKILPIITRGRINNEAEYQLLLSYADEIYSDDSMDDELRTVNSILRSFEKT